MLPINLYIVFHSQFCSDGTTDITRTIHLGQPSAHQKNCYTRVLKGQMALARAVFPYYAVGSRLDSFARYVLFAFKCMAYIIQFPGSHLTSLISSVQAISMGSWLRLQPWNRYTFCKTRQEKLSFRLTTLYHVLNCRSWNRKLFKCT